MIQVTGVLKDPLNQVASNTPIRIVTKTGFGNTLTGSEAVYATDAVGAYDFTLVKGVHTLEVQFDNTFTRLGYTIINDDTPTVSTLSGLLAYTEPLTNEQIAIVAELTQQAVDAAILAAESVAKVSLATDAAIATAADVIITTEDRVSASASATTASEKLAAVELIFDQFDDRYLGAKAVDPTVDNDGDPLKAGTVYFNTTTNTVKFYNGVVWDAPDTSATNAATAALASQVAVAADAAQTSLDRIATAADAAQTSLDRIATAADAGTTTAKATEAVNSANSANTDASTATTKANEAVTSANTATTKAGEANTSASNASTSESNAGTSEDNAAASATIATTQAGIATTKASEAAASAQTAVDVGAAISEGGGGLNPWVLITPVVYTSFGDEADFEVITDAVLPTNIVTNSRYVLTNPFGISVQCEVMVEIYFSQTNTWSDGGFIINNGVGYGAKGGCSTGEGIIVQTGLNYLTAPSYYTGNTAGSTLNITTAPCRVWVRRKLGVNS